MNASDNYLDQYKDGGIYDDSQYGGPYISKGVKFARYMSDFLSPKSKIICIGCGLGFEMIEYINQGHDVYGTEFHKIENVKILDGRVINAVVPQLPFRDKEFGFLHCTEVLEHIPVDDTDAFLKECERVSDKQFFSIATEMDTHKTHINLQEPKWWLDRFEKNGLNVKNFQYRPVVSNVYGKTLYNIYYPDGVTFICNIL